ncbi:hypothetical protein TIFTF001_003582 [Ficus carica]|uniref:Uncharacterized protein n=1 Tax=Ficus carica TaxID=3494 RepID=A0AA88CUG7_FICCA|nr:hypothetical protein TIFTF001_003582 [Ficus carica]
MGMQKNPKLPCMLLLIIILLIMMMISQFSSCRHVSRFRTTTTEEEEKETAKKTAKTGTPTQFSSQFSWHSFAEPPQQSRGSKIDPRYRASLRAVPGGPNPLHN